MIIKIAMITRLDNATTLEGIPYRDWRSEKYIGKEGLLLIIGDGTYKQHFQWHPINEGKVVQDKGIVSSNDDIVEEDGLLTVKTENSYYYFTIIQKEINKFDIPRIW